ncbi:MAG: hypothetical protein B6U72_03560 [Candidatus Altiarchaeales archaeon ex4484_2]|nr:MAG: hypothetical protein B6U72_03560 [Candidatus Altiarchaeales archaeon ex4484_2]
MSFLIDYLIIWFRLLFKPESVVEEFRSRKPDLREGILSTAYVGFLLGLIAFLFFSLFSLIAALGDLMAGLISLLISGAIFLVGAPLALVIILLVSTAFMRVASVVFKGSGSFSEECGILGFIGSCFVILCAISYGVMFVVTSVVGSVSGTIGATLKSLGFFFYSDYLTFF